MSNEIKMGVLILLFTLKDIANCCPAGETEYGSLGASDQKSSETDGCYLCKQGWYEDVAWRRSGCIQCPTGVTTYGRGTTTASECSLCTTGFGGRAPDCASCNVGTYKTYPGNFPCRICEAGTTSNGFAPTLCFECVAGKASSAGGPCTDCAANTESNEGDSTCLCKAGYEEIPNENQRY
jgi:hypothetical protein